MIAQSDDVAGRRRVFHIPCLDGVRGVAFLLVFAAHAGWGWLVPGGFGVTIFFFLSGYLITSLLRIEAANTGTLRLRKFYLRRALRILPPLYLLLVAAFVLGVAGVLHSVSRPAAYLAAVTFTTNYYSMLPSAVHGQSAGLEVVWSLCVEEHFYLFFPLAYLGFVRRKVWRNRQAAVLFAACVVVLAWRSFVVIGLHNISGAESPKWSYTATDCRFDSILWGAILAVWNNPWFGDRPQGLLARHRGMLAAVGGLGLLLALAYRGPAFRETLRYTVQGVSLYPIFYYCIAAEGSWVCRVLEWRTLRWIGELSYTLYLCHLFILDEVRIRHPGWDRAAVAGLGLALSIAVAWVMQRMVEGPLRLVRRRFAVGTAMVMRR